MGVVGEDGIGGVGGVIVPVDLDDENRQLPEPATSFTKSLKFKIINYPLI